MIAVAIAVVVGNGLLGQHRERAEPAPGSALEALEALGVGLGGGVVAHDLRRSPGKGGGGGCEPTFGSPVGRIARIPRADDPH
jgi:hypothetical protein